MPRLFLALLIALFGAAPAAAIVKLPAPLAPVPGNPADRLAGQPLEASQYDRATRCTRKRRPGVEAFTAWLAENYRGTSWGTYRCEKWGRGQASLHAEGRALDWHLDASSRSDRREATRIITLLLAPDAAGDPQALARRMGVQEIIWDCSYWGAWGQSERFSPYRPCYSTRGTLRRRVNATVAHRDHIHFGFTKAGAAKWTSFWR